MVCPIHTRNIRPIGPLSSTIPSPWIESLPKGRSDMPCMIQRATIPGKWLRPNHVRYIPRPTWSVLSTQEILDPSVHYPVQYHHLESSPYPKAGLICHAWFKELLYQENGCVPITYGTFQDQHGLSYPHKKYWTHRSIIKYYTITLNRVLTQRQVSCAMHDSKSYCTGKMAAFKSRTVHSKTYRVFLSYPHKKYWTHRSIIQYYTITLNRVLTQKQVSYAMPDSKSYCTRKMAASQSRTVHYNTHRVCPIHTSIIGPIGPLSSTIPSPWIEPLPKGGSDTPWMIRILYQEMAASQTRKVHSKTQRVCPTCTRNIGPISPLSSTRPSPWIETLPNGMSDMPWKIRRASVPGKWLRPDHARCFPQRKGCPICTRNIGPIGLSSSTRP